MRKPSRRLGSIGLTGAAMRFALFGILMLALPVVSMADCGAAGSPPCSGTFLNGFFDINEPATKNGTGAGDTILRLNNPTRANGNLCAMIYVFNSNQQMGKCCGCPVGPDKLLSLSVRKNLIANWPLTPVNDQAGLVDVISSAVNRTQMCTSNFGCNGGCDPTNMNPLVPTRALKGYMLHNQEVANTLSGNRAGLTEVPLADSGDADSTELSFLANQCGVIIGNGTDNAACSCGAASGE